jgi:hypothetical protein
LEERHAGSVEARGSSPLSSIPRRSTSADPALRRVVAKETLNRTGRSVYYALTEVCKDRDPSFKPARLAVEGVREGKYRAARGRPG